MLSSTLEIQMKTPSVDRSRVSRVLRLVVRWLVLAWAGFWAWFVVAVSIGEPPPPPLWIPAAWLAGLTALVVLCWKRPVLGGLALLASGVWAFATFANPGARALLAAPAIVLGLGCLASGWSGRSRGANRSSSMSRDARCTG